MTRRQWLYFVGGSVALAILSLFGFWTVFDRVKVGETRTGESREAQANHYLAFERFAKSLDRPLEESHDAARWQHLPEGGVVIFLGPDNPRFLNATRIATLNAWVRRGGHIIFAARGDDDPLMRWAHTATDAWGAGSVVKIPLPDGKVLQAGMRISQSGVGVHSTAAQPDFAASDGHRTPIIFYRWGKGGITILSSFAALATNDNIGTADNATVLWLLVSMVHTQGPILLLRQIEIEGWWLWLWHNGWTALVALGALIAIGLWALVPRFGPILPDPMPDRRALTEHLGAMGRAVWRLEPEAGLRYWLFCVRRNVLARAAIRDAGILSRSPAEQAQRIADRVSTRAGMKPRTVRVAVAGTATVEGTALAREGFTRAVRMLQRIEQQLRT